MNVNIPPTPPPPHPSTTHPMVTSSETLFASANPYGWPNMLQLALSWCSTGFLHTGASPVVYVCWFIDPIDKSYNHHIPVVQGGAPKIASLIYNSNDWDLRSIYHDIPIVHGGFSTNL